MGLCQVAEKVVDIVMIFIVGDLERFSVRLFCLDVSMFSISAFLVAMLLEGEASKETDRAEEWTKMTAWIQRAA